MSTRATNPDAGPEVSAAAANGRASAGLEPGSEWEQPLTLGGDARYSQSLERGLAILGCFSSQRPLLGIAELADMLGMSRSTTHRYVVTLVALGYLKQGAQRKYGLALHVTDLGFSAMSSTSLREHARAYVEELSRRSAYTVGVAILDGSEIVCVERVRGSRRGQHLIDLGLAVGSRLPAHRTAAGMLLMAHLPAHERRELIAELKLSGAIASMRALRDELESIPAEGIARSSERLAPGLLAIAAPVRVDSREVVAAVGMAAHHSMISPEGLVEHLGPHLVSTADRISARLGYRRDDERAG
jgi:IclR family pca regulon transcriptional regulator